MMNVYDEREVTVRDEHDRRGYRGERERDPGYRDEREYDRGYRPETEERPHRERQHRTRDGRPISQIVRDLRDEATLLIKQQMELAKAEMSAKASKGIRNASYIAVGGAIAYAGLIFLLLAATFGVMLGLIEGGMTQLNALWLAPLIVGLVVAIVGYIFVQKGISTLKRESAMPKRTRRTLQEDKQWLENKVR